MPTVQGQPWARADKSALCSPYEFLTDRAALATRKEAWADAYRHTPHGKPVELGAAKPHS